MKKVAVVLFNLGGPDSLDAVRPFLFNLFNDAAIIRAPKFIRTIIATLISKKRAPVAQKIYEKLGGSSPLLANTKAQAVSLERALNASSADPQFKCFIAMRYWHPFAEETARKVKEYGPDEIILLPLYPQYSTTTTQSSFDDWGVAAKKVGLAVDTHKICCYPQDSGFIRALVKNILPVYEEAKKFGVPRLILSAHGLPEKIIKGGDPYEKQCYKTVEALRAKLAIEGLDADLCFQSRVGPMKWIGPATDDEILKAARSKRPIVVAPVAFVSEHSETLVEINIEYRELAHEAGAPFFGCVPAVGEQSDFIFGLVQLVRDARGQKCDCLCASSARGCLR